MTGRGGFDWPAMMRAGVVGLGLAPDAFWRLSPAELLLLLGEQGRGAMGRSAFDALLARFPDLEHSETEEGSAP